MRGGLDFGGQVTQRVHLKVQPPPVHSVHCDGTCSPGHSGQLDQTIRHRPFRKRSTAEDLSVTGSATCVQLVHCSMDFPLSGCVELLNLLLVRGPEAPPKNQSVTRLFRCG